VGAWFGWKTAIPLRASSLASGIFLSRWRRLLAGSFIFCEADGFPEDGGFSQRIVRRRGTGLSKRLQQLARETAKEIVILHRHPLLTSARKMRLYSLPEHLVLVFRAGLIKSASCGAARIVTCGTMGGVSAAIARSGRIAVCHSGRGAILRGATTTSRCNHDIVSGFGHDEQRLRSFNASGP